MTKTNAKKAEEINLCLYRALLYETWEDFDERTVYFAKHPHGSNYQFYDLARELRFYFGPGRLTRGEMALAYCFYAAMIEYGKG